MNKLYKLRTELGDYWIIASHPTEAEEKLSGFLTKTDYGLFSKRKVTNIELIATMYDNITFITGHNLLV